MALRGQVVRVHDGALCPGMAIRFTQVPDGVAAEAGDVHAEAPDGSDASVRRRRFASGARPRYHRPVSRSVKVSLAGHKLSLRTDAKPRYIKELADYVNAKIEQAKASGKIATTQALALLAALTIADELLPGARGEGAARAPGPRANPANSPLPRGRGTRPERACRMIDPRRGLVHRMSPWPQPRRSSAVAARQAARRRSPGERRAHAAEQRRRAPAGAPAPVAGARHGRGSTPRSRSELDPARSARGLRARGVEPGLSARPARLAPARVSPGDARPAELVPGAFGIPEPTAVGADRRRSTTIDVFVVPGLAFDRQRRAARLGARLLRPRAGRAPRPAPHRLLLRLPAGRARAARAERPARCTSSSPNPAPSPAGAGEPLMTTPIP